MLYQMFVCQQIFISNKEKRGSLRNQNIINILKIRLSFNIRKHEA